MGALVRPRLEEMGR
jgi:hypothetical protein